MTELHAGSADLVGQMRVAAIVVTFNRKDQLAITIDRLLAEPIDHLVVVDNASTDGTAESLALVHDPRLHIIRMPANRGGAGGFEEGLRQTMARFNPDWCVVMDDDARPEPGAVQAFRAMTLTGVGAVAAAVYQTDGSICDMNRPSVNPFWNRAAFLRTLLGGGRAGFHLTDAAYAAPSPLAIDAASFVGLFLSRDAITATGLPDGRLFIYGDDVLYTLSMRRAGVQIVFAPSLRFSHDFKTFQAESRAFRPLWKTYYHHRNLMLVYHAAAGLMFWPALLLILPKWLLKARHYTPDRVLYLKLLWLAIFDAVRGKLDRSHPEVLRLAQGR